MSTTEASGFALWKLGFRPFYLLASIFGATSVLMWALQFSGYLPTAYLQGAAWHGHEMLFGFTTAIIAGFLMTAVRNWTNQATPSGIWLMGLAALWVVGRVLVLTPWATAAAAVNVAFPLAIAIAIGMPIFRSRNVRNYFFVGLLLIISLLDLVFHLSARGSIDVSPQLALTLALDVVLFIMTVIGGRVIPMFTNNGIPGTGAARHPLVEKGALGLTLALLAADSLQLSPAAIAAIALAAALAHGVRLVLWRPWRTLSKPLVWILHAAYAWIAVHLALRGLAALDLLAASLATHALTVGAIGGLTIGMMVRTARGHTGRLLSADGFELGMFVLVQIAVVVRLLAGLASGQLYLAGVQISAALWSAAFGLYAIRYWPVLSRSRVDGHPE